jgi:hypothetical protein
MRIPASFVFFMFSLLFGYAIAPVQAEDSKEPIKIATVAELEKLAKTPIDSSNASDYLDRFVEVNQKLVEEYLEKRSEDENLTFDFDLSDDVREHIESAKSKFLAVEDEEEGLTVGLRYLIRKSDETDKLEVYVRNISVCVK